MTDREMDASRRVYEMQMRQGPFERVRVWLRSVLGLDRDEIRRKRLDEKAKVERKAREAL